MIKEGTNVQKRQATSGNLLINEKIREKKCNRENVFIHSFFIGLYLLNSYSRVASEYRTYKKKFFIQFLVSEMRKGATKFLIDTKLIRLV